MAVFESIEALCFGILHGAVIALDGYFFVNYRAGGFFIGSQSLVLSTAAESTLLVSS